MDIRRSLSNHAGPRRSPHEILRRLTFHVPLPMSPDQARQAAENLLRDTGIKLFLYPRSNPDPRRCGFEISVGVAALEFTPREVAELIRGLPSRV